MSLRQLLFRILGKDPEAVVVSFCSGPPDLARRMVAEVRTLVPDREHFAVTETSIPGINCVRPEELPGPLRRKRIGLAPTLFAGGPEYRPLRWIALRMAPVKILAYNRSLERHHLQLQSLLASVLFLRGIPLDRIWLRPWWFPFRREHSRWPDTHTVFEGRTPQEGRRRVAILTPYFPFPLSHGGAVRIFNLLREASRDFDVYLFAFAEKASVAESTPVLDLCAKVVLFPNPRYREPRWHSILPPEVKEFSCPYVAVVLEDFRRRYDLKLLQVEYTQMARYAGDVLVEHDITFDLYGQVHQRERTLRSWWDRWRWQRFEQAAVARFRRVSVMSRKDSGLLPGASTMIIPNGVDLHRFQPQAETDGERLLFVGSFAHFPNVMALRWFLECVWPLLTAGRSGVTLNVIAGRNPDLYWAEPIIDPRIAFHGFISDVRAFYADANVVIVPTRVSAGTNLKVLEAMAMERAVVSTASGCAGLEVTNGEQLWIADNASDFAHRVEWLLSDNDTRRQTAARGRKHVQANFGWERIGVLQRRLWTELMMAKGVHVRRGTPADAAEITRVQLSSHGASQWDAETYFSFDVRVAERNGTVCGFLVSRVVAPDEAEVLNLAVAEEVRKLGIATALLESLFEREVFLEVRESNLAARGLYQKLGYRIVGRREDYYDDPVETALVMRRSRSYG